MRSTSRLVRPLLAAAVSGVLAVALVPAGPAGSEHVTAGRWVRAALDGPGE